MRTCRNVGIKTVAVYSDTDARAQHVYQADEAYWIGKASAMESYLRADAILDVRCVCFCLLSRTPCILWVCGLYRREYPYCK